MVFRHLGSHWVPATCCVLCCCVLTASCLDHTHFLKHIFDKYGSEGVITYEGFEHLLQNLGLGRVVIEDHEVKDHFMDNGTFFTFHDGNHSHTRALDLDSQPSRQEQNSVRLQPPSGVEEKEIRTKTEDLSGPHMATSSPDDLVSDADVIIVKKELPAPPFHGQCIFSVFFLPSHVTLRARGASDDHSMKDLGYVGIQPCLSPEEIYESYGLTPDTDVISYVNFLHLCPAIVYELDQSVCREGRPHRHDSGGNADEDSSDLSMVWMCSLVSVLVISLCGVLGVLVIPIMHRVFYHHLLQFLVAMAVGSLTGDAVLHLLPHAFSSGHVHPHEDEEHLEPLPLLHRDEGGERGARDEMEVVYKALATLGGMALFFLTERAVGMVSTCKEAKSNQGDAAGKKHGHVGHGHHHHHRHNLPCSTTSPEQYIGEKLSRQQRFSAYSLCFQDLLESENGGKDEREEGKTCYEEEDSCILPSHIQPQAGNNNSSHVPCYQDHHQMQTFLPPDDYQDPSMEHLQSDIPVVEIGGATMDMVTTSYCDNGNGTKDPSGEEPHHHHHHHHHKIGGSPGSMSAVAWMVILGDGLHNFSDGLAIGAAFASSLAIGFSTSIAVLCHELPHEIGDFAVLLKTGMTGKQALFYNLVSSILCFLGMIFGVFLGNIHSFSSWIFALTAGMFLYVALVDMLPELSTDPHTESVSSALGLLALQLSGMILGASIMLVIAVKEHDLIHIFHESS
ncbi:unnamed protein product [Darwinula stevensoni]|uniref:Uncharacterized protein n=1 Tax=Darwinula stevensoni TaxID=69355 RepID=A0A7R8X7G8_9CRUS|nr:unnamed protein product [Darwinula stevensoni]CAG0886983.1 unnamed protein product [Darwinula stevensoni]